MKPDRALMVIIYPHGATLLVIMHPYYHTTGPQLR
jgi:hypothetical protein